MPRSRSGTAAEPAAQLPHADARRDSALTATGPCVAVADQHANLQQELVCGRTCVNSGKTLAPRRLGEYNMAHLAAGSYTMLPLRRACTPSLCRAPSTLVAAHQPHAAPVLLTARERVSQHSNSCARDRASLLVWQAAASGSLRTESPPGIKPEPWTGSPMQLQVRVDTCSACSSRDGANCVRQQPCKQCQSHAAGCTEGTGYLSSLVSSLAKLLELRLQPCGLPAVR